MPITLTKFFIDKDCVRKLFSATDVPPSDAMLRTVAVTSASSPWNVKRRRGDGAPSLVPYEFAFESACKRENILCCVNVANDCFAFKSHDSLKINKIHQLRWSTSI